MACNDKPYKIQRCGDNVAALLDKIEGIGLATETTPGLITAAEKKKLNNLGIYYNTTSYWNKQKGYVPAAGELIIYSDYSSTTVNGKKVAVAGLKIGSGNAYVQDLKFLSDTESSALLEHIRDTAVHTTAAEKLFWNNKLNVTDSEEVVEETLIFNRN